MIYIAGKYSSKERLKKERQKLRDLGFVVSSSWMDNGYDVNIVSPEVSVIGASLDLNEVKESNHLILDTIDDSNTGGREVELGIALTQYKLTTRIGPVRNVFHRLCNETYNNWEEFFAGRQNRTTSTTS